MPPPFHGVCVWFTGLSGAGKTTTAEALVALLQRQGATPTLLDGDDVRAKISRTLGFSKQDRDTNVRRIGFAATEIVRRHGIAICAAVSPYRATRAEVRLGIGSACYVEVFVDTPLRVCEGRDPKGLYAKARRGEIEHFTGIGDPYEPPLHPEIRLDTLRNTPEANARRIIDYMAQRGLLAPAKMGRHDDANCNPPS